MDSLVISFIIPLNKITSLAFEAPVMLSAKRISNIHAEICNDLYSCERIEYLLFSIVQKYVFLHFYYNVHCN